MNWSKEEEWNYDNLTENEFLYVGILQVLLRKTAKIFHRDANGIFLQDTVSGAYMLAADDTNQGIAWMKEREEHGYLLMQICQKELKDYAMEHYGFKELLECRQAVFLGERPNRNHEELDIVEPTDETMKLIEKIYTKITVEEMEKIRSQHHLYAGFWDGKFVGFIGNHLEGSIGLLDILPEYRKRGFATELEKFMINHVLDERLIPFGQVETWNEKSMGLQEKIGMRFSKKEVYWLF